MAEILLRNAGYEPMRRVTIRKAHGMLIRDKVRPGIYADKPPMYGGIPIPAEIILKNYVRMSWLEGMPKYSKKRLFIRDNYKCAYCGGPATTKDHVKPKSKGGEDSWENLVAACFKCNSKKGNRFLKDSGMKLLWQPYRPTWEEVI